MNIKYLVELTPQCVSTFERTHRSRITSETLNCLFIIADCTLVYRSKSYASSNFKLTTKFFETNKIQDRASIPILVINQAAIFDWDQVEMLVQFPFVYSV